MDESNSTTGFSVATDEEIQKLLDDRHSKKTKNVISGSVKILEAYLGHIGMHTLIELTTIPTQELDQVLKHFYVDVRKHDGDKYTKKSMVIMRFGLQKHLIKHRDIDIINDKPFQKSNDAFKAVLVNLKTEGKAASKHKDIISDEDLEKLYKSGNLSKNTPATLQNKVWFDYMLYFCNRGRENLRETKKSNFEIKTDETGKKYVQMVFSRPTKNHRGDDLTDDDIKGGTMFELSGDPNCPVKSFELYYLRLNPNCDCFLHRPKAANKINEYSTCWYDNVPVGKNTLGNKMKSLSIDCRLSKVYTNHCIRATCISILDEAGISDRHIGGISGHKSTESLRIYKSKLSEKKKRSVSNLLCEKLKTSETINLPSDFSINPLTNEDIQNDPVITDFLTPSQEDRYLAELNMNVQAQQQETENTMLPENNNVGNFRNDTFTPPRTEDGRGNDISNKENEKNSHQIPNFMDNQNKPNGFPAMNLVSYDTIHFPYSG